MLQLKLTYPEGGDLLRECKNYEIIFDKFAKQWSYMLINGKEKTMLRLGKYILYCYTNNDSRKNTRPTKLKFDLAEAEFLKGVFSLIDLREKPYLAPLHQQFSINYDKLYHNAEKESHKRQNSYPAFTHANT